MLHHRVGGRVVAITQGQMRRKNHPKLRTVRAACMEVLEERQLLTGWNLPAYDEQNTRYYPTGSSTNLGNGAFVSSWTAGAGYGMPLTADVMGDSGIELIVGDGQNVRIYDGAGALKSTLSNVGPLNIVADVTGDGVPEIITNDTLSNNLARLKAYSATGTLVRTFSKQSSAPYTSSTITALTAIAAADLNNDGTMELVAKWGTPNMNPRGVVIFNGSTTAEVGYRDVGPFVSTVSIGNITGSTNKEIVFGSTDTRNGVSGTDLSDDGSSYVWAIDGTGMTVWRRSLNSGGLYDSDVMLSDLDNNGSMEVIATPYGHAGYDLGHIMLVDPATGNTVAGYERDFGVMPVRVVGTADLNNDGIREILVVHQEGLSWKLRALADLPGLPDYAVYDTGGTSLALDAVNDVNGDGLSEVIISVANKLYVLNNDLTVQWQWMRPDNSTLPIGPAIVTDIDADGRNEILVASGNAQANYRVDALHRIPELIFTKTGDVTINNSLNISGLGLTVSESKMYLAIAEPVVDSNLQEYTLPDLANRQTFQYNQNVPSTLVLKQAHGDVVASTDGTRIFFPNFGVSEANGSVSQIDLAFGHGNAITTIATARACPGDIGMSPDGSLLVVTTGQDGKWVDVNNDGVDDRDGVEVYNIGAGAFARLSDITLPDEPSGHKIAFSPDSRFAYIVTQKRTSANARLYEINLQAPYGISNYVEIPGATRLGGVAISDTTIYVSDPDNKSIHVIDRPTFSEATEISLTETPGTIGVNPMSKYLHVLLPESKAIVGINPTTLATEGRYDGLPAAPTDLEFSNNGQKVFVAAGSHLMVFNVAFADTKRQIVSQPADPISVAPGNPVTVPVYYTTSDTDNTLTGLGIRIHFDSTKLTYTALANVLGGAVQDATPNDDIADYDHDPLTDKYLKVAWFDLSGSWPNVVLPALLFNGSFTLSPTAPLGSITTVRFTTTDTAVGYAFDARPIVITASPTDLSFNSISATPASLGRGGTILVTRDYKVTNAPASPDFAIQYHLSADQYFGGADDVVLTPDDVITAVADKTIGDHSATVTLTVPLSAVFGTYYLLAKIDSGSAIAESNENNNVIIGTQFAVVAPDLAWNSLTVRSPIIVAPGAVPTMGTSVGHVLEVQRSYQVSAMDIFRDYSIQYRLSINQIWGDADDLILTTDETIANANDRTIGAHAANTVLTLANNGQSGSLYYVLSRIDGGSTVAETNEANNVAVSTERILLVDLDVDRNRPIAAASALTDGLIAVRYLFGFRGASLIDQAISPDGTRRTVTEVESYLASAGTMLDVDGDSVASPLTDGILIMRYLYGFRGATLVAGAVSPTGTRQSAQDVEGFLQSYMPPVPVGRAPTAMPLETTTATDPTPVDSIPLVTDAPAAPVALLDEDLTPLAPATSAGSIIEAKASVPGVFATATANNIESLLSADKSLLQ